MIELNPETVCFIIDKAHEFQTQEDIVLEEEPSLEGGASMLLAEYSGNPALAELKAAIDDLEPDQQVVLVALMWLGRGDYDIEEWEDALAEAARRWTNHTADYLIATPMLADYLSEALDQHGYTCG